MGRLSEIETFILIAEMGSFSSAAKELRISTAAVSKQMKKLEQRAELQLLSRSTRKVKLTDMGRVYLEQCRRIMEEVDASTALLSQMRATPKGALRVVVPKHFAEAVIFPLLPEFLSRYPEIELDLMIEERIPHLESENIDMLIGFSASAQESSIQRRITTTSYTICASPGYLKKHGTPNTLHDLPEHRCIAHSRREPCNFFYGDKGRQVPFKPFLKVNDAGSLAKLAVLGLGIVQLHHYEVQDMIKDNKLVPLLDQYTRKNVPIYYALPPRKFTPLKVQCLIDFVLDRMPIR